MLQRCFAIIISLAFLQFAIGLPLPFSSTRNGTAEPVVFDLSDKNKTCPTGFEELGKQCARTIFIQPEIVCPSGGQLTEDGYCVRYFAKNSECLAGFTRTATHCVRTRSASKEYQCPEGYLIRSDNKCVKTIVLPDREMCPAGSEAKGDTCTVQRTDAPNLVCPEGFTLNQEQCVIEEIYDCTPAREQTTVAPTTTTTPTPTVTTTTTTVTTTKQPDIIVFSHNTGKSTQQKNNLLTGTTTLPPTGKTSAGAYSWSQVVSGLPSLFNSAARQRQSVVPTVAPAGGTAVTSYLRFAPYTALTGASRGLKLLRRLDGKEAYSYPVPAAPPVTAVRTTLGVNTSPSAAYLTSATKIPVITRDYIAASTCKRLRMVPAEHICPIGVLDENVCRYTLQVPPILTSGGVTESVIDPETVCPAGFSPDADDDSLCIVEDEMTPTFYCPTGSEEEGDRCVVVTTSQRKCSAGYALEGDLCAQTQIVPPLVKYTVTYACEGKECP